AQSDALAAEYQTIYAKTSGSKAAPTAGLHFTQALKDKIKQQRDWVEVTLHVGLGTFAPLTPEQLASGHLHKEHYEVTEDAAATISAAPHVTAVGTTSVRTLESIYQQGWTLQSSTDILIQPGYEFKRVDSLVTNFHLPGTSLLLLVAAFIGTESELERIYQHAIAQKYRFYSFGDAMLIV
nr:S-adenosylmethionine:tRNA ribosyltransferase-isomerase [Candidatus Saccharibacteria bacterium]